MSWGSLRIKGRIGSGGFGDVLRAWDPRLEREVALKILRDEAFGSAANASQAIEEGRKMALVRHPHVITVHGADRHDGRAGIWMELLRGRTLADTLREQGPFGAREAALIGVDLCHALAAIHAAGLVHRDVKAQNVMREAGGRIVLMDLGAGVERSDDEPGTGEPASGTPLYMAPEVLAEERATPRSDLYGLGVLLFHLVTGAYPLEAGTLAGLRELHDKGQKRLLRDVRPDLPPAFVRVVERALATEPQERYGSAGEMERDLATALGVLEDRVRPGRSPGAWRRAVALAGVAAVLGLSAFLLIRFMGWQNGGTSYRVEAAFRRETPEGSERLLPGARIAPGDKLFLDFRASRPVHLYVINQDERGESYLLFPLPDLVSNNPLAPDVTHRLPGRIKGKAKEFNWEVSTAGGREHFVIVASPQRLDAFEREALALARPSEGAVLAARLGETAAGALRSVGGLAETDRPREGGQAGRLFEMAARLGSDIEGARGVWVRQFDLENPMP